METTVGIVTALNPVIGYEKATELANEAYKSGKGILEVIREKKVLTEEQIKDLLDPVKLTNLDQEQVPQQRSQSVSTHASQEIIDALSNRHLVTLAVVALVAASVQAAAQQQESRTS